MKSGPIVMLAGPGSETSILFNALNRDFELARVVLERPTGKLELLSRRARSLGLVRVAGQALFQAGIAPWLKAAARERRREILRENGLDDSAIPEARVVRVDSVNSARTVALLRDSGCSTIVVQGTRLIAGDVLAGVPARFINMHMGITPLYRGVHGGYWALAEGRPQACGVTVHLIDRGIDTGAILGQARIAPGPSDNYATYPFLQLAAGLPLLREAVAASLNGHLETKAAPQGMSRLFSHPTIWEYARNRWRGVR